MKKWIINIILPVTLMAPILSQAATSNMCPLFYDPLHLARQKDGTFKIKDVTGQAKIVDSKFDFLAEEGLMLFREVYAAALAKANERYRNEGDAIAQITDAEIREIVQHSFRSTRAGLHLNVVDREWTPAVKSTIENLVLNKFRVQNGLGERYLTAIVKVAQDNMLVGGTKTADKFDHEDIQTLRESIREALLEDPLRKKDTPMKIRTFTGETKNINSKVDLLVEEGLMLFREVAMQAFAITSANGRVRTDDVKRLIETSIRSSRARINLRSLDPMWSLEIRTVLENLLTTQVKVENRQHEVYLSAMIALEQSAILMNAPPLEHEAMYRGLVDRLSKKIRENILAKRTLWNLMEDLGN